MAVLRSVLFGLACLLAAVSAQAGEAGQGQMTFTINVGSLHVGSEMDLNERNPGLGIGYRYALSDAWELNGEAGFYRNSFNGRTVYGFASADYEMLRAGAVSVRMGGFAGLAEYPDLGAQMRKGGAPVIGDWLFAAGGQAVVRLEDVADLRFRVLPAGAVADALFTAQLAVSF